jgi:hypothetical protein
MQKYLTCSLCYAARVLLCPAHIHLQADLLANIIYICIYKCAFTPAPAAYYTETLKYNKQFKVRVAGDSKSTDTALCVGYKPDKR